MFPWSVLHLECEELAVPSGAASVLASSSMMCFVMLLLPLLPKQSVLGESAFGGGDVNILCYKMVQDHFLLSKKYFYD